jgi:nucleoside-diphosphate-sugar epimerase
LSAASTSAPVLVTGAAGFVGSHLVDTLLARDAPVRVLVRSSTDRRYLDPARVTFAEGDVCDASPEGLEAIGRAAAGCAVVYHAAGITQAPDPSQFERVNAEGAARVARAVARSSVPRLVLVSSQAAGGATRGGRPRTEEDPDAPAGAYGRSKLEGELRAAAALTEAGGATSLVIVRPPAVYGPRDRAFALLFKLARRGIVPLPGGSRQLLSLVHARDLAEGIVLAAERGQGGRRYYVAGGPPVTSGQLVETVGQALGKKPLRLDVPSVMLVAAVAVAEVISGITGRPARITRDRLSDLVERDWTLDDTRARTELGYAPRIPLEAGIEETALWYRNAGWI